MKKTIILLLFILTISVVYAHDDYDIEINNVKFKIPPKYQNGQINDNYYKLENVFSISLINDNIESSVGLWDLESDYSKNLNINNHPVRYYYQYNPHVHDNYSHAYFSSADSFYEITWIGNNLTSDIENMIKNTPKSDLTKEDFYNTLDEAIDAYKEDRTNKLNQETTYYHIKEEPNNDKRLNEILITQYNHQN